MAALFLLALGLIFWQARSTEPLPPVSFSMVNEPGEQMLPLAVPSWREVPTLPENKEERLRLLEARSLGATGSPGAPSCRLFLRVSAHHWLQRPLPGPAPAEGKRWFLPPESLLDDDDGDGDLLDPGELTSDAAGAEAEVFCG